MLGFCDNFIFFESATFRMGKGEYDLSEMYIVRYNYGRQAERTISSSRVKGTWVRSAGMTGLVEFEKKRIVPSEVYTGLNYGMPTHNPQWT